MTRIIANAIRTSLALSLLLAASATAFASPLAQVDAPLSRSASCSHDASNGSSEWSDPFGSGSYTWAAQEQRCERATGYAGAGVSDGSGGEPVRASAYDTRTTEQDSYSDHATSTMGPGPAATSTSDGAGSSATQARERGAFVDVLGRDAGAARACQATTQSAHRESQTQVSWGGSSRTFRSADDTRASDAGCATRVEVLGGQVSYARGCRSAEESGAVSDDHGDASNTTWSDGRCGRTVSGPDDTVVFVGEHTHEQGGCSGRACYGEAADEDGVTASSLDFPAQELWVPASTLP